MFLAPLSVGLDDVEFNNPARSMLLPKSSLEKTVNFADYYKKELI